MRVGGFFSELKRRNVFRVAAGYAVVVWIVLQVASVIFPPLGVPDWVMTGLTVLTIIGFPIAIIISWFYEWTPEGLMTAEAADAAGYAKPTAFGRQIDFVIIALMAVAIAWLIWRQQGLEPAFEAQSNSIAVLPFVNLSSDPEQEYFSDGIAEELLNVLAQVPDLQVAARTSSFRFRGENRDITDIARQLNVAHVLEGSVRKGGDTLRITAQLIDANTGFHLWSATYDREIDDIFAVQDEISAAIVDALRINLGIEPAAPSRGPAMQAYDLLLKGRSLLATRELEAIREAATLFEETVKLAPDYAEAHAMLAMARLLEYTNVTGGRSPANLKILAASKEVAERALAIDPGNVTALTVLASYHWSNLNLEESATLFARALEISPTSAVVNNWYGDLLTITMQLDEALVMEKRAAELDPLVAVNHRELAGVYALSGHGDEALAAYEKAEDLDPGFPILTSEYAWALMQFGTTEDWERAITRQIKREPSLEGTPPHLFWLALARGDRAGAASVLKTSVESGESGLAIRTVAVLHGILGNYEKAAETLLPWSDHSTFIASLIEAFPSNPDILAANPTYAAMWRTVPLDRVLKARGHLVELVPVKE